MRKAQKKQAEEFVELLGQVHNEIKKAISAGNAEMAQELLGQCQQGAIELGNLIEKTEGEGFVTVSYLEKYCEIVYSIYQELGVSAEINAEKLCKHLNKGLLAVKNSIKNDIPLKKEIVFFPYKASMWDSLESVYLAAKEDPNCDAYCVPIPYFDKNPDGSFGQIHYEGREYPKNIEVIDWQTYNLEERRPDVVYIHNPYDEYNYVTSVHPRFYSSNLKKYTDELVYIPYFVLEEVDPQDETMIERMRHFCLQPGVFNANKVILQSEDMSEIYRNEYQKAALAQGMHISQETLKKKFLGLGSPKVKKILNTKKEDLEIPEEWLKIIQKPDGSWKKIFFYNTGVTALLQHDEKMLGKMKWVFGVFQEKQDEIALLWRPHPLIKATIESLRPELWLEYEQIVNAYKEAGWGIYDDSADMDRAVVLSDAYYGDASSVAQLCLKKEIPVMIQNIGNQGDFINPCIVDAKIIDNRIWMVAVESDFLCSINLSNNEIEKYKMPVYGKEIGSHRVVEYIENSLFLLPFKSNNLLIFDLIKKTFKEVKLIGNGFFATARYKEHLFLFGLFDLTVNRINIHTGAVDCIEITLPKDVEVFNDKDGFFRRQVAVVEEKLYAPFCNANAILEVDPLKMSYRVHKLGNENEGYAGIIYQEGEFWLPSRQKGYIAKWKLGKKYVEKIKGDAFATNQNPSYLGIIANTKKKILISRNGISPVFEKEENIVELNGAYQFLSMHEDEIVVYEEIKGVLEVYSENAQLLWSKELRLPRKLIKKRWWNINPNKLCAEGADYDLMDLLEYMYI